MRPKSIIKKKFDGSTPTIKATQLEVAIRQLVQAVNLFFFDQDPISIHSLTRNAEEIISALLKKKGEKSMWSLMVEMIKPERQEEFRKMIDSARNAFKHRIMDEKEIIEMPLEMNEQFLLICTQAIHQHWPDYFKRFPELLLFEFWYIVHNPDIILDTAPEAERLKKLNLDPKLTVLSKKDFYDKLFEISRIVQN